MFYKKLSITILSILILGHLSPSNSIPWEPRTLNDCGRVSPSRVGKILSGEDALRDEFPWVVSIKSKNVESSGGQPGHSGGGGHSHFCGGFVIDNRHIISAAHCFRQKYNPYSPLDYSDDGIALPASMTVSLGQYDLTSADMTHNTTIEYIALHPDFEIGGHLNNDIAILRTQNEMKWDINIHPICLPEEIEDAAYFGQPVIVAGWGSTNCFSSAMSPSKTLKKIAIPVWKNTDCLKAYKEANYDFTREGYVCAGEFDKDTSKGDSGSPLMMLQNNKWTAIGIVSAGRFMCEDRVPGVYTKISNYISFIKATISGFNSENK